MNEDENVELPGIVIWLAFILMIAAAFAYAAVKSRLSDPGKG